MEGTVTARLDGGPYHGAIVPVRFDWTALRANGALYQVDLEEEVVGGKILHYVPETAQ